MAFGGSGGFSFSLPTTGSGFPSIGNSASKISSASGSSGSTLTVSTPSSGGFNFSTPTSTTGSLKTSGFSFSTPTNTSATGPSSSSFNFGSSTTAPASGPTSFSFTNPATAGIGQTSSLFNLQLPTSSATTLNSPSQPVISSTSTISGLNFGSTTAVTTSIAASGNAPSTLQAGGGPISFGTKPLISTTPSLFSSGTSAFTSAGGGLSSAAATLSTATTTSSLGGPGSGGAPNLSVRQLEEKVNKWHHEMNEQQERFLRQAAHVNSWDQILQNGHDQVQALKDTLHTVKLDQSRLEAELDFIRSQQEELERLLEPLESAATSTPPVQLHQGDHQRDNMYHLALTLDGQLRQMTDDLGKVIEHLNSASGSSRPNDPVTLIARILSAHMDSLHWVDQNTAVLSQKMEELSKVISD